MSISFFRQIYNALMPKGSAWSPAKDGYLDKIYNSITDNQQSIFDSLHKLQSIRDPYKCPESLLSDLEREYGISPDNEISVEDRRKILSSFIFNVNNLLTAENMQNVLDIYGFGNDGYGLKVTQNAPVAVCPYELEGVYHNGYDLAIGDIVETTPNYLSVAGHTVARAFDGSDYKSGLECAGFFLESYIVNKTPNSDFYKENNNITRYIPPEKYWSYIFFIGGEAIRDADGVIINIKAVNIPEKYRERLHWIVLRNKPLGMIAVMVVNYVQPAYIITDKDEYIITDEEKLLVAF